MSRNDEPNYDDGCTLWMGDVMKAWDEEEVRHIFKEAGYTPTVVKIPVRSPALIRS